VQADDERIPLFRVVGSRQEESVRELSLLDRALQPNLFQLLDASERRRRFDHHALQVDDVVPALVEREHVGGRDRLLDALDFLLEVDLGLGLLHRVDLGAWPRELLPQKVRELLHVSFGELLRFLGGKAAGQNREHDGAGEYGGFHCGW